MDDKILFLYAQGLSTREIVKAFYELYGGEVSPTLISKVTDPVIEQVVEWQARPLDDSIYGIGRNPSSTVRETFSGQGLNGGRGAVEFLIKGNNIVETKTDGTLQP